MHPEHQGHPGRGYSAGRTSCWAHNHSGELVVEREPTGHGDGVEKAPAGEGHRGSRRGCPDFLSGRIEAFAVAASGRVLGRVCCETCDEGLRGRECAALTCGVRLGVVTEVRVLGRRDALLVQGVKPSQRARSRQCNPTRRPRLPLTRCILLGCRTRPGRPRSPLRR